MLRYLLDIFAFPFQWAFPAVLFKEMQALYILFYTKGGPFVYESKKRPPKGKAEQSPPPFPPRTEEEEEKRACGLAMNLAMQWLRDGTAPAQVVCHFLKIQSQKEQKETLKIEREIKLLETKQKSIELSDAANQRFDEAMKAFASYSGKDNEWETIPDDYPDDVDYRP